MSEKTVKAIKGYEDIYSISIKGIIKNIKTGKELQKRIKNGYYSVVLYKKSKRKDFLVHRLIAESFIPNPDNKSEVNHINGKKLDNRLSNLEWVTHAENQEKAKKSGLYLKGSQVYNSIFSDEQVQFIREVFSIGYSKSKLSRVFNVQDTVISDIINNESYKSISKYNEGKDYYSPQVKQIIYNLLENGFTYSEISSMCGLHKESVRNYYRHHYLPEKQKN